MRRLLTHMHTRVKSADRPDRRQPSQHERPARGPGGQILNATKHIRPRIHRRGIVSFANRQRNDGSNDKADVEENTNRLDFGHDPSEEDGDEAVREDGCHVRAVDDGS